MSEALPATKTHELKVWPPFFDAVRVGNKTFEVRKDDRDFTEGDTLILREWNPYKPEPKYTGRECRLKVTYKLTGGHFGIEAGFCVLGISRIDAEGGR